MIIMILIIAIRRRPAQMRPWAGRPAARLPGCYVCISLSLSLYIYIYIYIYIYVHMLYNIMLYTHVYD